MTMSDKLSLVHRSRSAYTCGQATILSCPGSGEACLHFNTAQVMIDQENS